MSQSDPVKILVKVSMYLRERVFPDLGYDVSRIFSCSPKYESRKSIGVSSELWEIACILTFKSCLGVVSILFDKIKILDKCLRLLRVLRALWPRNRYNQLLTWRRESSSARLQATWQRKSVLAARSKALKQRLSSARTYKCAKKFGKPSRSSLTIRSSTRADSLTHNSRVSFLNFPRNRASNSCLLPST